MSSEATKTPNWQEFAVRMIFADGESWEVHVWAVSPEWALSKVLRRKAWCEALLSERRVRFFVQNGEPRSEGKR